MKLCFLIVSVLVMLVSAPVAVATQPQTMTWTIDGEQREALVYSPAPTISNIKHPLVFAFHGHGGNMQGASQLMHIQSLWPAAIVGYPQGQRAGGQQEAGQNGDRDLKFFDAMLATMKQNYTVDDARIYTTGFSNG